MYTISDDSRSFMDPVKDASDSFGHLSLDENQEIRYHGSASGLPLLARSDRKDDIQKSNGIWNFDVANVNAEFEHVDPSNEEGNQDIQLPHPQVQIHLLELYFTYIHPMYPVIHKQDFLANYDAMTNSSRSSVSLGKSSSSVEREPIQKPCKLLLLSMFAIAARYSDQDYSQDTSHGFSKAGQEYVSSARILLNNNYQCSRPSTCQALLLLAVREFGVGSMQQGWLYTGMALRMAVDLGMNRDADRWMDGANELFSPVEKQIRKHIWWSCCTADKFSAIWLGRPITFRANDYSTTFLDAEEADEYQNWHPYPHNALGRDFSPVPGRIISCWREACSLSVIITDIMDKIYPVKSFSETPRRTHFEQLETRLHQWLINLQDHLRYCTTSKQITPLPHILALHIEYCAAVLLLHRAFLPPWNEHSMATVYDDTYGLDRSPPFMSIFLQSAGIMHVITLTRRPWNAQATVGLRQCITSLKHMERTWPSTMHIRMLLEGAKVQLDQTTVSTSTAEHRPKRSAGDALGDAKNTNILEQQTFEQPAVDEYQQTAAVSTWDYSANARIVAQTLGIDVPGFESSTSFYPGYQWWPHTGATEGLLRSGLSTTTDMPPASSGMDVTPVPGSSMPQQAFTFDQHQLSQEFVEGVNYPLLDFSRFQSDQDHHS
ncbi:Nitrogen assimilation transcription factor nirA [Grifola frondosa]|uniref:Nitrogen assimilation transcription factor nirA n=1 Tax=Grifola frondosa TaxID=5627 RepID=A0A1C7MR05_GRIFR|nr:Nitrogen assimilation transcription factor nirA [Grifola frondosa]